MRHIAIGLLLLVAACADSGAGDAGPVTVATPSPAVTTDTTVTPPPPTESGTVTEPVTTDPPESTTTLPPAVRVVEVFFVADGAEAVAVTREVPDTPGIAAGAVRALIAGPTGAEGNAEIGTAIPADTLLLGLDIADGLATIDLSREFEAGGGSFSMFARLAQVVYTLTEFDTVDRVAFRLDGEDVSVFSGEGIVLEGPVNRADYEALLPLAAAATALWSQDDLPDASGVAGEELGTVVLVEAGDTLNVRTGAGVDNAVVGRLLPGTTVIRTGAQQAVGASTWAEVRTPGGTGWVNDRFLAVPVDGARFAADGAARDLLDALTEVFAARVDPTPLVSRYGLWVAHHAPPIRLPPDELPGLLTSSETRQWPSNAAGLEDVTPATFADAVAASFVAAYDDLDRVLRVNEPVLGPNGRPAAFAIPPEFAGFNYFAVYDPGDDPTFGGLDWTLWYVSITYEGGAPRVIGLTKDEWAP